MLAKFRVVDTGRQRVEKLHSDDGKLHLFVTVHLLFNYVRLRFGLNV